MRIDLRQAARSALERWTGWHVYRILPRGFDVAFDISRALPAFRMATIFDVGANVGQTAQRYAQRFPEAHIYSFEPVRETFRELESRVQGLDRIHCFRLALGASNGSGEMALEAESVTSFLLRADGRASQGTATEQVEVATLDGFCAVQAIGHVNYLKIDTEGGDLEVLKGATRLLGGQLIDFVEVEAGMNPANHTHVPFRLLRDFLESCEYRLFGIYSQVPESRATGPHLRRTNSTFISRRLIEAAGSRPMAPAR